MTDAQHVAAIQSCGFDENLDWSVTRQGIDQAMRFRLPARRSHNRDDGDFIYHHRGIFDKNGIRKFWLSGKSNDSNTQFSETILIRFVLCNCFGDVNPLSRVKRQLAM